ncbi:UDP-N-acetylglucosamine 2-epimerase (hydrolyzing) [Myxococcota bacterium]|nr:UDP-N-acetylglucosamine 2-epimerase (hydrolyzing) [Myxococcota bacterium]MBU1534257.1 UDP-N-acetylglucosamine 2-epimerase (hydrolyzing) [Myxococcota bacterium]
MNKLNGKPATPLRVKIITTSRADYGIYQPLLRALDADPRFDLGLLVTGMHLLETHGFTVKAIETDGFHIHGRVPPGISGDSPHHIATAMGIITQGFAKLFENLKVDLLITLGDRYEMFAAAAAAVPFGIPIAHIHGGETTKGAIDECFRHSLTKMAHIHFPCAEEYAKRITQLGEEPWRVHNVGALAIDQIRAFQPWSLEELESKKGVRIDPVTLPLVVTYHPVTLEAEMTGDYTKALMTALDAWGGPVVFTMPNADTHGSIIRDSIQQFCRTHATAQVVETLGSQGYFSLLHHAAAMVGNSSSGILEAPSFKLPVVNIGNRQAGRMRSANIIDVPDGDADEILQAIRRSTSPQFNLGLQAMRSPFGEGDTAKRIIQIFRALPNHSTLLHKHFMTV